jgi:hypothetical protein
MFGVGTGAVVIWITNSFIIEGSLHHMRKFSFLGAGLTILGISAYAVMAWSPRNASSFIGARFIGGVGLGIQTAAGRYFINRTARGTEIKELNATYALSIVFGLGFGPLLQAGQNEIFGAVCGSYPPTGKGAEYQGMMGFALSSDCCVDFSDITGAL